MKIHILLAGIFLSSTLHGKELKPCQIIGYDSVEEYAIPGVDTMTMASANMSIQDREQKKNLLKKCINNYSVCIVETPPKNSTWLSEKLIQPINKNFVPGESHLLFGMIQYVDKKTGDKICIVAQNGFSQTVPWYGVSWVNDGKTIKQYEIWDDLFSPAITPSNLYKALFNSQKNSGTKNDFIKSYNAQKPSSEYELS